MSTRTLSPDDIKAAQAFAAALERSGKTHEEVAAEVGVTPGMIHQWAKPLRPISFRRAAALARAVGIADPAEISVGYRDLLAADFGAAHWPASSPSHAPLKVQETFQYQSAAAPAPRRAPIAHHLSAIAEAAAQLPPSMLPAIGKLLEAVGRSPADPSAREALVHLLEMGKNDHA